MLGIIYFSIILVLIMAGFRWYGLVYYKKHEDEIAPKKKPITPKPVHQTISHNPNEEITPVIFAAVCAAIQPKVRIKKIQFVRPNTSAEGWGQTGRIQNMSNHWMSAPKTFKY